MLTAALYIHMRGTSLEGRMDPNPDQSIAQSHSMLVVADKDLNPVLFDHLLTQKWKVEYVSSNEEALSQLRKSRYDLILTAEGTSAKEDIRLLQQIRVAQPHVRMIILTRESTTEDVLMALRQRAFSFFSPPYTVERLTEMIHMAMEGPAWDDGIELVSGTPVWVRLLVRCDRKTAERLMQFFEEMVDVPDEEKNEIAYAFREMLINAMNYGGKFDPQQYVEISYFRTRHAVACRVKDPGEGFSLEELYHAAVKNPSDDPFRHIPVREAFGLPPGGFGILLSLHLVDELIYNEQGNEVLLVKYLNPERRPQRADVKVV
jgi:DNA-binding NarL/FixJ family response regulator/anti-sigma regulatory factor (Ser/Thr protein kinase)